MDAGIIGFATFAVVLIFTGGFISLFLSAALYRVATWAFQKFSVGRAKAPPKSAVIITGCSSGIGLAAAIHLASEGLIVFAAIRKQEDEKVFRKNSRIIPFIVDVTKENEIQEAAKFVSERAEKDGLKILGLVNNGGYSESGVMEMMPIEKLRKQLEVNVIGQVAVTQAFLPVLRKLGEKTLGPRVVFVSSGFGLITFPGMGAYCASKHAIEAIGDAFRMELQSWGIHVVVLQPGSIKTNFNTVSKTHYQENTFAKEDDEVAKRYQERTSKMLEKQVVMEKLTTTTQATNEGLEAALLDKRPLTRYQCGLDATYGVPIVRQLPDKIRDNVFARFFK